jgi:hypothetical protein
MVAAIFDFWSTQKKTTKHNRIGGVIVSVLASSVVDRGFKPRSGQTIDYQIGICCFSAKHAALKRKGKDWLIQNQNYVSRVERHVYPWTVVSVR